jgi:hypothetical protein
MSNFLFWLGVVALIGVLFALDKCRFVVLL